MRSDYARAEPLIRVTAMPADTNPYGGVFGGWLMSQMALAAGSLASRTARGKCVVVAADVAIALGELRPVDHDDQTPLKSNEVRKIRVDPN